MDLATAPLSDSNHCATVYRGFGPTQKTVDNERDPPSLHQVCWSMPM